MSKGIVCKCEVSESKELKLFFWVVTTRNGNYSAFNGYRFCPSQYSQVMCLNCEATWRSKSLINNSLKDYPLPLTF